MTLTLGFRKLLQTVHITFAVGWLGAVAGFLSLAIAGLTSQDAQMVNAAYRAMEWITRFVIVPSSILTLLIGPLLALGTPWGLFQYYWVLAKLIINIVSTFILLEHTQPISHLSHVAAVGALSSAERSQQLEMMDASGAAILALLAAITLAVYKPLGLTPYGRRKQRESHQVS